MSQRPSGLSYDRSGRGEPLVLLHPLGADRQVWKPLLPFLESEREVIRVDLPGFGASPALSAGVPPTPGRLAGAVIELLRDLNLDRGRAHLAGNSLGGWVALETALAGHGASVTAIAPAGLWRKALGPKPLVGWRLARAASPLAGVLTRVPALKRGALSGSMADPGRVPPAEAAHLIRAYAHAPDFVAVNAAMRSGRFDALADIEAPVTLVWPSHDRLIARPSTLPPQVEEILLPGCGHMPMWDHPAAVARALLTGSRRLDATPRS